MDAAFLIIAGQFSIALTALTIAAWYMLLGLGIALLAGIRYRIIAAQILKRKLYGLSHAPAWHAKHLQTRT